MELDKVEDDEDWVVVKKQRIIILIPSLSPTHHQTENTDANHTNSKPKRSVTSRLVARKKRQYLSEERDHKSATILEDKIETEDKLQKHVGNTSDKSLTVDIGGVEGPRPLDLDPPFKDVTKNHKQVNVCPNLLLQHAPVSHLISEEDISVHSSRQAKIFSGTVRGRIKLPIATSNVVNRKMWAISVKRRLQMFGGLRSWLLSLGLSQLIETIEREKLGIYQLLDLTMSKLKDMGVIAVGPRRKLINAIDSLCQPHHLKALK